MQTIKTPDGGTMVMMPLEEYEALVDAADLAAAKSIQARIASGEEEAVPADIARRLVAGGNPVRVWREYRDLTAAELARRAGVSRAYMSQIETGNRTPGLAALKRLARALNVDLDDLTD